MFFCRGQACGRVIGEKEIREEWKKTDLDPTLAVIDVRPGHCELLERPYANQDPRVFSRMIGTDGKKHFLRFWDSYLGLRGVILGGDPRIRSILGMNALDDKDQIERERQKVSKVRAQFPQPSLETVLEASATYAESLHLTKDPSVGVGPPDSSLYYSSRE